MGISCDICEKSPLRAKKVTLIWGLKYRSIVRRKPNLRKTVLNVEGENTKAKVCAKCLKSIKRGKIKGLSMPLYPGEIREEKKAGVQVAANSKPEIDSKTKGKATSKAKSRRSSFLKT
ncbi:hypothetical protein A2982_00230 [candidate division WWE3 bacterium RIFCSPLOWO2_01_FULL_39_13]|uniref:50S ribosomal protein L28 n=1 Tax=candidate division WWE3 bacterium RIFCSPLOWO2_01_FULL_39_13 TaxID=1802624 RepID=A0A1F4V494_UNCKA|nr:MAG: hypothetical protein A2982_00230 [candidate division WWE3 bacterium RIFCSPLOWO2_01_FULL_39_13]